LIGALKNRYNVKYEITTKEPLVIGSAESVIAVSEAEIKTIKHHDGVPYIPGSSLRGVMRSTMERYQAAFTEFNFVHKVQDKNKDNSVACDLDRIEKEWSKNNRNRGQMSVKEKIESLCDLCRLFGANGYGSPLKITDACIISENLKPELLEDRTHVSIDRNTDTARDGSLFSVEAVSKDVTFTGQIIFDDVELEDDALRDKNLQLFKALLKIFTEFEFYLGGMRSRGYGLCKFNVKEIRKISCRDLILGNEGQNIDNIEEIPLDNGG